MTNLTGNSSTTMNSSSTAKAFDLVENTFSSSFSLQKDQSEYLDQYVSVLSKWICEYADINTESNSISCHSDSSICQSSFDAFFNPTLPEISMYNYLKRIVKMSEIEYSTLIIACLYIDKIVSSNKLIVTWFNIYR
jgi:hypothetical protein